MGLDLIKDNLRYIGNGRRAFVPWKVYLIISLSNMDFLKSSNPLLFGEEFKWKRSVLV